MERQERIDIVVQEARRKAKGEMPEVPGSQALFPLAVVSELLGRLIVAVEELDETIKSEGTATRSQLQSR